MNRWIATLKKHGNAPETERQKCQNSPWSTYGTFGTASSGQNADFSEQRDNGAGRYVGWSEEARRDLYEERAAIMEFEGGLTREAAEEAARRECFAVSRAKADHQFGDCIVPHHATPQKSSSLCTKNKI